MFDKNRVYTALNAEELKIGSKIITANNLKDLKDKVNSNWPPLTLDEIGKEDSDKRFYGMNDGKWCIVTASLAYLIEEPKEYIYYIDISMLTPEVKRLVYTELLNKENYAPSIPLIGKAFVDVNYIAIDTHTSNYFSTYETKEFFTTVNAKEITIDDALNGNY